LIPRHVSQEAALRPDSERQTVAMPLPPRHLLVAGILVAVSILLISTDALVSLWSSFSGVFISLQRSSSAVNAEPSLTDQQVETMRERFVQMSVENVSLRNRLKEYESIRGEGGVAPQRVSVARGSIVARSARSGRRFCELDVGALDGVEEGMAAIAGWSLIGSVASVQENRCLVQQLTDSESRVPAALFNGQDLLAEGVISGTGRRDELALNYLEDRQGLDITPGLRVVSAGLNDLPAGIGIGLVSVASRSASSDHWTIQVVPMRVAETVDSVLIVTFGE
jgi:rod shape-determining protein MreC